MSTYYLDNVSQNLYEDKTKRNIFDWEGGRIPSAPTLWIRQCNQIHNTLKAIQNNLRQ